MLNRLPQVVTLKPQRETLVLTHDGRLLQSRERQLPFLLRAIYFVLIGGGLARSGSVWPGRCTPRSSA